MNRRLAAKPDDAEALIHRGWLFTRQKKWREAIADLELLLKLCPGDSDACWLLGAARPGQRATWPAAWPRPSADCSNERPTIAMLERNVDKSPWLWASRAWHLKTSAASWPSNLSGTCAIAGRGSIRWPAPRGACRPRHTHPEILRERGSAVRPPRIVREVLGDHEKSPRRTVRRLAGAARQTRKA